ncbi:MAG TPA: transaldolase, partial [bacterium]|nr:transaldolase [bacterium]
MTALKASTLELIEAGQSPWLDYISRQILDSGKLKSLIKDSGLLGVTSNPSIFEKAISDPQGGYEKEIHRLIGKNASTFQIYDTLTLADIRRACDLFLPVFQKTKGEHGFVSLEVMPGLAHEREATVVEAVRLFRAVGKPNVMIKVPATKEGLPAIRQLIAKGININITLMFSVQHYRDVVRAYMEGLKDLSAKGGNLSGVHSVASVFVSRVDTLVDKKLSTMMAKENSAEAKAVFESLVGKAACANAKIIYQEFKKILSSQEFIALQAKGANIQKVLWGSTSTKNPNYPDLIYVENLIGRETVNTMPLTTLEAFLDHGKVPGATLDENLEESHEIVRRLHDLGMELTDIGEVLQQEGVKAFSDSFDSLMRTIEHLRWKEDKNSRKPFGEIKAFIPQPEKVNEWAADFQKKDIQPRFFRKDPSLWKLDPPEQKKIANRLGWLDAIDWMFGKVYALDLLAEEIKKDKIRDIVLLGMGGSSLAPEVMSFIFKKSRTRYPRFHILDTTDAANILRVEKQLNLSRTLFIVASKSGTTIETVSQFRYFYDKVRKSLKPLTKKQPHHDARAGKHFIAITDEDSWLEKTARELGFRSVFINPSDIGGRFSALSYFGMVPAALMG